MNFLKTSLFLVLLVWESHGLAPIGSYLESVRSVLEVKDSILSEVKSLSEGFPEVSLDYECKLTDCAFGMGLNVFSLQMPLCFIQGKDLNNCFLYGCPFGFAFVFYFSGTEIIALDACSEKVS